MASNRRWTGFALAALLLPVAGLRADDDKVDGDLKKLQGQWTSTAVDGHKVTYTVKGKMLKVVAPSRTYQITLALEPEAKPEKTVDFRIDEAPDDAKGKTSKGIYKFDGDDKFVFCFSPEGDRPAKYEMEGYEKIVTTLVRSKD